MKIPYVFKKCSKCGKILLATTDNFYRQKRGKFSLMSDCKECRTKYQSKYNSSSKGKEARARYKDSSKGKEARTKYYTSSKGKETRTKYLAKYYASPEKKKARTEYLAKYFASSRGKEAQTKYLASSKGKETRAKYNSSPKGQIVAFNSQSRRRTRLANNGGEITKDQWLECMSFFNFRCAYSGEKLTKDNRSLDHIVCVKDGGSNNIWNVVPMLRSLNSSKQDKDMIAWYKEQDFYSEERLAKIREWEAYASLKYEFKLVFQGV